MSKYEFRIKGEYIAGKVAAEGFMIQYRKVSKFLFLFSRKWKDASSNDLVRFGGQGLYRGAFNTFISEIAVFGDFGLIKNELKEILDYQQPGSVSFAYFNEVGRRIG